MTTPLDDFVESTKKLAVKYIGTSIVKDVPRTVEDVIEVLKKLGKVLETSDSLHPITKGCSKNGCCASTHDS